jgi:hypothetical protein
MSDEQVTNSPAACSQVDYGKPAEVVPSDATESVELSPPNPNGATLVGVGFHVIDLRKIDPVQNHFEFRGYVRLTWCDPRLAFDSKAEGQTEFIFTGEQAEKKAGDIWLALGYPVNQVGELGSSERVLRIQSDGTVVHSLNASVTLSTRFDLRRFPFDRHILELQVESYLWDRDHLQLIHDDTVSGFSENISIPEWRIESVNARVDEVDVLRSNVPFERYVLEIEVAREAGFYIWKVFLPLMVIVSLSWVVFWMTDDKFSTRCRITATGVLTIVAYQFVFAEGLPRVAYLTLLDLCMIGSFVLLAVTVIESLLVDRTYRENPEKAIRIDRTCRWLFPAVYAAMLASIAAYAG